MTATPNHPTPETVAALRAREPGTILLFKVPGDRFAAYGPDAPHVYFAIGGRPGSAASIGVDGPRHEFPASDLEPLLSALAASGRRAAVCEPAKDSQGQPVERVVTEGDGRWT